MGRRESNLRYYQANRECIILRESELRPSKIIELLDCLREQELQHSSGEIGFPSVDTKRLVCCVHRLSPPRKADFDPCNLRVPTSEADNCFSLC